MTKENKSQTLKYSTFKTVKEVFGIPQEDTWESFKHRLKTYYQKTISNLTTKHNNHNSTSVIYLLAGETDATNRRTAMHMLNRTMITLDIDKYDGDINQLQRDIKKCFNEYTYIAHNTASCTFNEPRARIILPLQTPVARKDYSNYAKGFINSLSSLSIRKAINSDLSSSTTPNQLMALPYHRSKSKERDCFYIENDNEYMVATDVEPATVVKRNPKASTEIERFTTMSQNIPLNISKEEVKEVLEQYDDEQIGYDAWFKVGQALHHQYSGSSEGLWLFTQWSLFKKRCGDEFNEASIKKRCAYKYKSCKKNDNPITFASIIKIVKDKKLQLSTDNQPNKVNPLKWLHTKGKKLIPLDTTENFRILLGNYGITCSFDVLLKKEVIVRINDEDKTDYDYNLSSVRSLMTENNMPTQHVKQLVSSECYLNPSNPWRDVIIHAKWDGVNREEEFYRTITVLSKHEQRKRLYMRKWIMQMLHVTCFNDDVEKVKRARSVLVFQGGELKGKTGWVEALAPKGMRRYIESGKHVNIEKDMDKLDLVSCSISELSELDGIFTKSAISALKSFLTSTEDKLDIKYKVTHAHYRRRTVFYASVNKVDFLDGSEENTRFFVLPVEKCKWNHKVDMTQLYAQFIELYKNDSYYLNDEEINDLINYNKNYIMLTPIIESFKNTFKVQSDIRNSFYNGAEVMSLCGINNYKRPDLSVLCNYLNKNYKRNTNNGKYILPPLN